MFTNTKSKFKSVLPNILGFIVEVDFQGREKRSHGPLLLYAVIISELHCDKTCLLLYANCMPIFES